MICIGWLRSCVQRDIGWPFMIVLANCCYNYVWSWGIDMRAVILKHSMLDAWCLMLMKLRVEFLVIIEIRQQSDKIIWTFSCRKTNINLVNYSRETIAVWCFFAWPYVEDKHDVLRTFQNHTLCSYLFCLSLFILQIEKSILCIMDNYFTHLLLRAG